MLELKALLCIHFAFIGNPHPTPRQALIINSKLQKEIADNVISRPNIQLFDDSLNKLSFLTT